MKKCEKCGRFKESIDFVSIKYPNKYVKLCMECRSKKKSSDKNYYDTNKYYLNQQKSVLYFQNKNEILAERKAYYRVNKEAIKKSVANYQKLKRQNDPSFKLRQNISVVIGQALKNNDSSKYGASVFDYLPYSVKELKNHLENQFEYWMNWNNYGKYNSSVWNDNDCSTWTWNIDHIMPQSLLSYASMKDDNFIKCWSLNNLRPLSSKQNLLDGAR